MLHFTILPDTGPYDDDMATSRLKFMAVTKRKGSGAQSEFQMYIEKQDSSKGNFRHWQTRIRGRFAAEPMQLKDVTEIQPTMFLEIQPKM